MPGGTSQVSRVGGCQRSLWCPGQLGLCGQTLSQGRQWRLLRSCQWKWRWKGLPTRLTGAPEPALSNMCWSDLYNVAAVRGKAENCSWRIARQSKNCVLETENWNTEKQWLGWSYVEDLWPWLDVNPGLLISKPSLGPQDQDGCSAEHHLGAGVGLM